MKARSRSSGRCLLKAAECLPILPHNAHYRTPTGALSELQNTGVGPVLCQDESPRPSEDAPRIGL
jgi:hypothetical protein